MIKNMHFNGINWVPKDEFPLKSTKKTKESKHASLLQGIFVTEIKLRTFLVLQYLTKKLYLVKMSLVRVAMWFGQSYSLAVKKTWARKESYKIKDLFGIAICNKYKHKKDISIKLQMTGSTSHTS